jgi:pyridoxal phosphate enzyme (YggS family)
MDGIAENLKKLQSSIPANVRIVAVSKTKPVASIMEAYRAGQRIFGENKVQEMVLKQPMIPSDAEWHFIGHLQTNKVRYIAPFIVLIHSIDSLNLLNEVNKEGYKNNRVIDCLLQFHIATEETKFGLNLEDARKILESSSYKSMKNIRITGVMGMSSLTEDQALIRKEFRNLGDYYRMIKSEYFENDDSFRELSMGMSGDYNIAIEEGSTIVRIGTSIFGAVNDFLTSGEPGRISD